MKLPKYSLEAEKSLMTFEFTSSGPRGQIRKIVKYSDTSLKDVYNLSFDDKKHSSVEIDDEAVSNNADSNMVLTTVVSTVYAFTNKYPDAWIFAAGSTKSKDNEWVKFEKDTEYGAFLVKRILL